MGWGFLEDIGGAVAAPFTSTVSSAQNLLKGNVAGALSAQVSGLGATLKPVGTYTAEFGKGFLNAGRGAFSGLSSLSRGDLKGTGAGAARFAVSGTNIAVAENTARMSPTGYGAISQGDTSPDAYRRAVLTTATLATAGAASAAGGGGLLGGANAGQYIAGGAALASGNYKGAAQAGLGLAGGVDLGFATPESLKNGYEAISPYLPTFGGSNSSDKLNLSSVPGMGESAGDSGGGGGGFVLMAALGVGLYYLARRYA